MGTVLTPNMGDMAPVPTSGDMAPVPTSTSFWFGRSPATGSNIVFMVDLPSNINLNEINGDELLEAVNEIVNVPGISAAADPDTVAALPVVTLTLETLEKQRACSVCLGDFELPRGTAEEKRTAIYGEAHTFTEFAEFYGDTAQWYWDQAKRVEAAAAEDSAPAQDTSVCCMPCGHMFHTSCLGPWLERKHTCPVCRFKIATRTPQTDQQPDGARLIRLLMGSIDPADQQAMGPINARIAVAAAPPAAAAGEGAGASVPSVDPLLARLQELMRASLGAEGEASTQSPNTMQSAAPAPAEMAPVTPPRANRVPAMPLQTERVQAAGGLVGRRLDLSGIVGRTASLQARA